MANTYDADKHDIGIAYSGTTYGLMLATEEYRVGDVTHHRPIYQTLIDEYIAEQQATGTPGYEHLPPEKELSHVQSSHRAGFGLEFYDSTDPERYNTSQGMDLRQKGMAILSNEATAIATLPTSTVPTLDDGGFESWDNGNLNEWTLVTSTLAKGTDANKRTGTYSAALSAANGYLWQELPDTQIQGRRFTFSCWVKASAATSGRIAITEAAGTTYSRYHTGGGDWEQLSVTRTLSQTTTYLRVYCVRGGDTIYFDDASITRATIGNPSAHCFFNGINYVALGGLLTKEDSDGDEFEGVYEFASPITSMKTFPDGFMYIAQESAQLIEDCEDDWTDGDHGTSHLDTGDYKVGSASVKIIGSGVVNGDIIAYEPIDSLDLSYFTGVKLWIKSSAAVGANDLALILSDKADCTVSSDIMLLPALTAGVWTRVYLRQADPSANVAILSVGLEYNANAADTIIHIDDIKAESSYWYMDTGEEFTQSTLAVTSYDSFAKFFQPVTTTMWKVLPPHRVYSSTEPTNTGGANWSGATVVDTPTFSITWIASDGSSLYIGKQDRVFYLTSAGAVAVLIGETEHLVTDISGKHLFVWKNKVYFNAGEQGLLEYDAGTVTHRGPCLYSTRIATFNGRIQGLAGDGEWLFAIIDNDTAGTVEVLAGRNEVIAGTERWVWHPYQRMTMTACELAFTVFDYQKRLYIGSTNSANDFFYIPLPVAYGNVAGDANIDVPTTGTHYFTTPKLHYNFRGDLKTAIKVVAELGHAHDTLIYFECWAKMGDGSWVDVGDLKGTASTRIHTLYFAANTTDRNLQLKFVGETDDAAKTPILLWYDVRSILYASRRNLIACTVRCADKIVDKAGDEMTTTAAEIRTYLGAARDATYPVAIEDLWSTAKRVRVLALKGQPFSTVHKAALGENIEEHFHLLLEEVTVS